MSGLVMDQAAVEAKHPGWHCAQVTEWGDDGSCRRSYRARSGGAEVVAATWGALDVCIAIVETDAAATLFDMEGSPRA